MDIWIHSGKYSFGTRHGGKGYAVWAYNYESRINISVGFGDGISVSGNKNPEIDKIESFTLDLKKHEALTLAKALIRLIDKDDQQIHWSSRYQYKLIPKEDWVDNVKAFVPRNNVEEIVVVNNTDFCLGEIVFELKGRSEYQKRDIFHQFTKKVCLSPGEIRRVDVSLWNLLLEASDDNFAFDAKTMSVAIKEIKGEFIP